MTFGDPTRHTRESEQYANFHNLSDGLLTTIFEHLFQAYDLKFCTTGHREDYQHKIHFGEIALSRKIRGICKKWDRIAKPIFHSRFTGTLDLTAYHQYWCDFEDDLEALNSDVPGIADRIQKIIIHDRGVLRLVDAYEEILLSPYRHREIVVHMLVRTPDLINPFNRESKNSLVVNNGDHADGFKALTTRYLPKQWLEGIDNQEEDEPPHRLTFHVWQRIRNSAESSSSRCIYQHAIVDVRKTDDMRLLDFDIVDLPQRAYQPCGPCDINFIGVPGRLEPLFRGLPVENYSSTVIQPDPKVAGSVKRFVVNRKTRAVGFGTISGDLDRMVYENSEDEDDD